MNERESLTSIERLLLIAAEQCGLGPQTDLGRASTFKIVRQAARLAGLPDEVVRAPVEGPDWHPAIAEIYATLVRMTHQTWIDGDGRAPARPGPALFEGGGNWGSPDDPSDPPAWPLYNSCRLTALGIQIARRLSASAAADRPRSEGNVERNDTEDS